MRKRMEFVEPLRAGVNLFDCTVHRYGVHNYRALVRHEKLEKLTIFPRPNF